MSQRFTIDGSDSLEAQLDELCARAAERLRTILPEGRIAALLLGGGYGRGEGGVLRTVQGDWPYNDVEFYLLVHGSELVAQKLFGDAVHAVGEELSHEAGVEVEFKLLSLRKLEQSQPTMFYYDLISGHRCIHGSEDVLARCDHHRAAHRIPMHEATRLLMNRCSGLLFAKERLKRSHFGLEDADFAGRNLAKAKLAFGDVVLAARGLYHWSCLERHKRLQKLHGEHALSSFPAIIELHRVGVDFKLHPFKSTEGATELNHELQKLAPIALEIWLWLESHRLGNEYEDPVNYAYAPDNKCPDSNPLKNRLINLRQFGPAGLLNPTYPRERLLSSLPLLLWCEELLKEPKHLVFVQRQLRTKATEFPDLVQAYQNIWRNYN